MSFFMALISEDFIIFGIKLIQLLSFHNFLTFFKPVGVIHGEELRSLIYQAISFPPTMKGIDRLVSEKVVEFWTNFVIYG